MSMNIERKHFCTIGFCCPPPLSKKIDNLVKINPEEIVGFFIKNLPEIKRERLQESDRWIVERGLNPEHRTPEFPYSRCLESTASRKALLIAAVYFAFQSHAIYERYKGLECNESSCSNRGWLNKMVDAVCTAERYKLYAKLPQIKLLSSPVFDRDKSHVCYHQAFKGNLWFDGLKAAEQCNLVGNPLAVTMMVLMCNEYKAVKDPKIGDVAVYYSREYVTHYANVIDVKCNGSVIVRSKFGEGPIFEHPLEATDMDHGDQVVFVRKGLKNLDR